PVAKSLYPVLTLIKRTEDRGGTVKAAFCQFEEEFDIRFGQIRHKPFIQNQYLESCILVQYLVLSTGNYRFLSVFLQKIRESDISGFVLPATSFFCHCTAKEGLARTGISLEHDAAAFVNEPATGQVSDNASVE